MFISRSIHPVVSICAALITCASARAQVDVPHTSIDLDQAREAFVEAQGLSDADHGTLWGEDVFGPTLLVNAATRFVVANAPDKGGVLEERDGVWVGTLPIEVNIAATTTDWMIE